MTVIPLEDRVLITQDEAEKEKGGIIIPEAAQQRPAKGTILKIGPGKPRGQELPIGYLVNDVFTDVLPSVSLKADDRVVPVFTTHLKEGDKVMFAKYAGTEIEVDGEQYLIMRFSDIICRI